jgi:transposase
VGVTITAAAPAEVRLAEPTLNSRVLPHRRLPRFLISDLAYDSDPLRARLAARHVTLISPHRINRIRPSQDRRHLRRYRARWIVERTIAWYGAFRRLVVRYERSTHMFLAFFQLASALIALRRL